MSSALDARLMALLRGADDLDEVAVALFRHQVQACPAYRRLVESRAGGHLSRALHEVTGWRSVPWAPIEGFRNGLLCAVRPEAAAHTFVSSGTTAAVRGIHRLDSGALYRAGALRAFERALLPAGAPRRIISLVPQVAESSLATMVGWVLEAFAESGGPPTAWTSTLQQESLGDQPVLVLGTALGLLAALDAAPDLRLPAGSAIMETGGFKGQRAEITRAMMFERYARAGVPAERVVGEYGMAELSSQWYDGIVGSACPDPDQRVYFPPPWARTRVVDPVSLIDVPYGGVGLLLHFDPLNRGSVSAILTQDLGVRRPPPVFGDGERSEARDGFTYVGRASGAPLKGCSSMELEQGEYLT